MIYHALIVTILIYKKCDINHILELSLFFFVEIIAGIFFNFNAYFLLVKCMIFYNMPLLVHLKPY